jgi:hypothetical protein
MDSRRVGARILGEVTRTATDTLRLADHIFIEELRKSGWYDRTSQAFAAFLPVKSVGVTGDGRRHDPVIAKILAHLEKSAPDQFQAELSRGARAPLTDQDSQGPHTRNRRPRAGVQPPEITASGIV